jgi:hypothetical protein
MSQFDDDEDMLTGGRYRGFGGDEEDYYEMLDRVEEETERRIEDLREGYHTDRSGRRTRIRYMETRHLQNSVNWGRNLTKNHGYWDVAVPIFEAELQRRGASLTPPKKSVEEMQKEIADSVSKALKDFVGAGNSAATSKKILEGLAETLSKVDVFVDGKKVGEGRVAIDHSGGPSTRGQEDT